MSDTALEPVIEARLISVEREVKLVHDAIQSEITLVRNDFERIVERHSSVLERIADKIELALKFQRDSLPLNLVMKLFTFFTGLVIVLLASVFGIKWLITQADKEILDKATSVTKHFATQEHQ